MEVTDTCMSQSVGARPIIIVMSFENDDEMMMRCMMMVGAHLARTGHSRRTRMWTFLFTLCSVLQENDIFYWAPWTRTRTRTGQWEHRRIWEYSPRSKVLEMKGENENENTNGQCSRYRTRMIFCCLYCIPTEWIRTENESWISPFQVNRMRM